MTCEEKNEHREQEKMTMDFIFFDFARKSVEGFETVILGDEILLVKKII